MIAVNEGVQVVVEMVRIGVGKVLREVRVPRPPVEVIGPQRVEPVVQRSDRIADPLAQFEVCIIGEEILPRDGPVVGKRECLAKRRIDLTPRGICIFDALDNFVGSDEVLVQKPFGPFIEELLILLHEEGLCLTQPVCGDSFGPRSL